MSLEDEQKRENRHIELIRALDRLTGAIGTIGILIFLAICVQVCR